MCQKVQLKTVLHLHSEDASFKGRNLQRTRSSTDASLLILVCFVDFYPLIQPSNWDTGCSSLCAALCGLVDALLMTMPYERRLVCILSNSSRGAKQP